MATYVLMTSGVIFNLRRLPNRVRSTLQSQNVTGPSQAADIPEVVGIDTRHGRIDQLLIVEK